MVHHLAQLNIARPKRPMDAPVSQGFVDELEPVNALVDAARGFVWRLQTEDGDATSLRLFDDARVIVNLSVWESIEDWRAFSFSGRHMAVMRQRRKWFEKLSDAYLVMWWIPAGHEPTPQEALERLELLRQNGPSPDAFTLRRAFSPLGELLTAAGD